ncbi:MAG TPA: AMP-binding protein [Baekduia sp.]|nr:AMP-binding protein [Baekduia sp.]
MVKLAQRPWHELYGERPENVPISYDSALAMARATMARCATTPLLRYFDGALTGAELDAQSDALAVALAASGFRPGDRLAAQLQNMPQTIVALVAAWKLGGTLIPINPMYKSRELGHILKDSGAGALVILEELWDDVGRPAIEGTDVKRVLTASPLDHLGETVPPLLRDARRIACDGTEDLAQLIAAHLGQAPEPAALTLDDPAALIYTSGTTGTPKGAIITHRNLLADTALWPAWLDVSGDDALVGVAPLFHITGLAAGAGLCLLTGAPLLLTYRFDPEATLTMIERHGATFIVAAITVYSALMNHQSFSGERVASLRVLASGGAPVAPAIVQRWKDAAGTYIHNCYGLTETTSLTHLVPLGQSAPVDPASGALSIGIPVSGTDVEIHDDDGRPLPPGEIGELVIGGPQVAPGYWRNEAETAHAFPDGRLRTGDVGFMDAQGWFYLVDRRKDLIVASGYKVWPREVEDALLEHPAVREAAVVGAPDEYRGETVQAYVSLRPGHTATDSELMAFCKERMAAYKYPREVFFLDELPKTPTGKILRRELRQGT